MQIIEKQKSRSFWPKRNQKNETIKDRTEKDQVPVPGHSFYILLLGVALSSMNEC